MRVALVCDEFYPDLGGIAHYGYELALQYAAHGVDFEVITHFHTGQADEEYVPGIRIKRIKGLIATRANRIISPVAFHRCHRYLASGGFDVIHGLTMYSPLAMMAVQFAQRKKIASVVTCHSIIEPRAQILLHLPLVPILRGADRVIGVSRATSRFCRALTIRPHKIVTVPNGVDTRTFKPDVNGASLRDRLGLDSQPIAVTALRLERRKNPDQLVTAFARVLESVPHAILLIAGSGREEAKIHRQARERGISGSIIMMGQLSREQVAQLMAAGDVFVLPTRLEAFGLAALEAAACGTPVVCADAGGIREVFVDSVNSLLFTPGDDRQMAASIIRLMQDPSLRTELGANAIATARRFTWELCARRTLCVYEEAHRNNASRRSHR